MSGRRKVVQHTSVADPRRLCGGQASLRELHGGAATQRPPAQACPTTAVCSRAPRPVVCCGRACPQACSLPRRTLAVLPSLAAGRTAQAVSVGENACRTACTHARSPQSRGGAPGPPDRPPCAALRSSRARCPRSGGAAGVASSHRATAATAALRSAPARADLAAFRCRPRADHPFPAQCSPGSFGGHSAPSQQQHTHTGTDRHVRSSRRFRNGTAGAGRLETKSRTATLRRAVAESAKAVCNAVVGLRDSGHIRDGFYCARTK